MCDSTKFKKVIDFGENPLVNSLLDSIDGYTKEPTFPLVVKQCQECNLVQVKDIVDADEIYKNVDYLYFTGDMPNTSEYFKDYADDLKSRFIQKGDFVVEIGSNDGTMLQHLWDKSIAFGVDPASNVAVRALRKGIPTISDFFSLRLAKSIRREFGQARIVYGNNCIAHLNDLRDLMDGVNELLMDDGVFVVECNYWGGMVKNKNYALIYHDHFSYFTAQNWVDFGERCGLKVFDAMVTPAQGGSLRIFLSKNDREMTERCKELLAEEVVTELASHETCERYEKEVREEATNLFSLIDQLKKEGKTIAGYGAAAKGFSVLKLAGLGSDHIDYFVDDSPAKQGKFTPISHIPVIARKDAKDPDYFFITAPNYEKEIIEKEEEFRKNGGKFITVDCRII